MLGTTLIPVIKMSSKFSTIFFMTQVILLAVAMASNFTGSTNSTNMTTETYGCFKQGELWKDLGTTEDIVAAYDEQWCKIRLGMWKLGWKVKDAARCSFA